MAFERCNNIEDFRRLARRRLPAPLFHYVDGGADDEVTLQESTSDFDRARLVPDALAGVGKLDTAVTVLGQKIDWPVFLSPTGMSRLFHHDGELAVARAAANAGTMYSLSTMATTSIEDVAKATSGPKCFQIYIHKDRELTYEFVDRCKAAGYHALCLTVDTPVAGNRERDLVTGMVMPPRLTLKSLLSFATHFDWAYNYLTHDAFQLANVAQRIGSGTESLVSVIDHVNAQFDPTIQWADAEKLIARWGGPFAIKGIVSPGDAKRAVDAGATALMVSNHGGRQLDGCVTPFGQLPAIVDAVGDRAEVILDGGVRRGTHVMKALALGARACMIGRGYVYPLAAGGQPAVERALARLRAEIERNMVLMGCTSISQLDRSRIVLDGFAAGRDGSARTPASPIRAVA
ncbi:MAG: alpha-hydroxy-acid oxidizing protein [Hyphomicrobiaceae bacterium]|nr:alpha-hydroxy-acid oxidizing protein [Hyphomicrobiaceae bacterium]